MVNLLLEKRRGKTENKQDTSKTSDGPEGVSILGQEMKGCWNRTEAEVAFRLDRYLRERPQIVLTPEQLKKTFACAVSQCPAAYIDVETLEWSKTQTPAVALIEKAVHDAVRRVTALNPMPRRLR